MKELGLEEILAAVHGRWLCRGRAGAAIAGVSTDSRSSAKGQLFVAIKGEKFDGHLFLEQVG